MMTLRALDPSWAGRSKMQCVLFLHSMVAWLMSGSGFEESASAMMR